MYFGRIAFPWGVMWWIVTWLQKILVELNMTLARCLNQSCVSAMPQTNLIIAIIEIKFGTVEVRCLNWP